MEQDDLSARQAGLSDAKRALLDRWKRGGARAPAAAPVPDGEPRIGRRTEAGPAPLAFAQLRLWFLDQLEPGNPAYILRGRVRLSGRLRPGILLRAFREIVARHDSLRTVFLVEEKAPVQVVLPRLDVGLPEVDLSALPPERRQAECERQAERESEQGFDLVRGPLVRGLLVRFGPEDHLLLLATHHIVYDGVSQGLMLRELGALYGAFLRGEPSPLPPLPIQYADFAAWQHRAVAASLEADLAYWRRQLANAPAELDLPLDRPRPPVQHFVGGSQGLPVLPPALTQALAALARGEGATLFTAFLSVLHALLLRYTGQTDILIGSPVTGRHSRELEGMIGLFVNMLVLRGDLSGRPGLRALLGRLRRTVLEAFDHQALPFERVVEDLRPDRNLGRNPLFQVVFAYHSALVPQLSLPGLTLRTEDPGSRTSTFDFSLHLRERNGTVDGALEFSTDLFDATTAQRLLSHFRVLVEEAVAAPDQPLADLPLLLAAERHQAVAEWNDTAAGTVGGCLHERIAAQAERTPDAVAVVFAQESLTYRELERRANRLAHFLIRLGVQPEARVGIFVERSPELLVGLLGAMKAGAAYVPLDPSYPAERLSFLLASSETAVVLTQKRLASRLPGRGERTVLLDQPLPGPLPERLPETPPELRIDAAQLAYVLYTSGSTGAPKGVMVAHRSVVNYLAWCVEAYGLAPGRRSLVHSSIGFDLTVTSLFAPLLAGGEVHLVAEGPGIEELAGALREGEVQLLKLTPAHLEVLSREVEPEAARGIGTLVMGGEALLGATLAPWRTAAPGTLVVNEYGPTEATVGCSVLALPAAEVGPGRVPIGRPISNARLHVADRNLQPLPPGARGELFLGGGILARGYLGRPDLTAERFLPDPFGDPGARLYRTGDIVFRRGDGSLEFVGRNDHQVKIRGFRIELGEIEAALSHHPQVREAVVVREDRPGDKALVAYVVAEGEAQSPAALQDFLREKLPAYMVPTAFAVLDRLPLTANGKVDRGALPAPERVRGETAQEAPGDPLEEMVAAIWREVLGIGRVGLQESFFDLGGHSLMATQVRSRLRDLCGVDLPLRKLFEAPTVSRLAQAVREARSEGVAPAQPLVPLPPEVRQAELPLSFAQQRLWILDQIEPDSGAYNQPAALCLSGELSPALLRRIFAEVARRHELLRTTFPARAPGPVQVVAPAASWPELPLVDLGGLPEAWREARVRDLALEEGRRSFDLQRGPLLRLILVRLEEREHLLLITLHHIVSDGWSWGVLLREIATLYEAFSQGRPSPLPELPVQYADFAVWQREWLRGEVLERQLAHWKRQLAGAPQVLDLPTDRPRPAVPSHRGGMRRVTLSPDLSEPLAELCRRHGATPFMALLGAWAVLLGRHAGQEQVLVGTPVAGRSRRELEDLIGLFVNTLVLRTDLTGDPGFAGLLVRVRETALDAFTHQDLPFERLVEEMAPERDLQRSPIFQVLFILQNAPRGALELPGLTLRQLPGQGGTAKFDLTLNLVETGSGLGGFLEYDADLFDEAAADRLLARYATLLAGAVATPDVPLTELPLLLPAELRQLLVEWNDTAEPFPRDLCVHELVAAQAARTPDAVAVSCGGERLLYRELWERASRLARRLARLGVGPEVLVGLCAGRSPALLVGLLGVLKAGGAYVPLDPAHPRERLGYILADAGAPVLVTERALLEALPPHGARVVFLDEDEGKGEDRTEDQAVAGPESLAYVIYTSGSTGRPKGVAVRHRGVVNYLSTMAARPGLTAGDVMMAVTTLSFDIAVTELLLPLAVGARVELVDRETAGDPALLAESLESAGATCMQATPATWTLLVEGGWPGRPGLRALCGGEAFPRALADRLLSRVGELWNVYGPTETTVWSARHPVAPGERAVPLGLPLGNTVLHLVGFGGELVPVGAVGELLIGGEGLARGYHGRPDLTAERFVPDPFGACGSRLYRTGDLARRLPDGTLDFLGRIDHQVKVRGFRIELGEIEAVLASHPAVREAVVLARQDGPGDRRLVGYVVPQEAALDTSELRAFLGGTLPPYMIPGAWVVLPALPLSPNGKVDRKALPPPELRRAERGEDDAPQTPAETALARIWEEVLGVPRVGRHDNFFELGGDSIRGVQVVFRAREAGLALTARDLFRHQGLAEAAAVAAAAPEPAAKPEPAGSAPADFPEARIGAKDLDKLMARIGGKRSSAAKPGRSGAH